MGACVNFFGKFLGFGSFGAKGVNFLGDFSQEFDKFLFKFTLFCVNSAKNSTQMLNFKGGAKWQD